MPESTTSPRPYPGFREALSFWFKLGWISFGGPIGQIAILHEFLVEKKKWISEKRFLHALNYCMLLPGPEAQQLATYTGWLLHGVRGGVAAGVLFVLPSMVVLWTLSFIYVKYGQLPVIQSAFLFLRPAVIAIVIQALLRISRKSLLTPWHYAFAVGAFIASAFFSISFLIILLAALLTGLALMQRGNNAIASKEAVPLTADENAYVIHDRNVIPQKTTWRFVIVTTALYIFLWLLPLVTIRILQAPDPEFWNTVTLFFTKAAFITFGGAYAVLPYVAHQSVEVYQWLTTTQMIDGLALGETTPGPLIMVLAFVGFISAYQHFDMHLGFATLGLTLTTFYTFLPSFFFILLGAPFVEGSQANPKIKALLGFVAAIIPGVLLEMVLKFGQAVLVPLSFSIDWRLVAFSALSFVALHVFKVNMILWIGISLILGIGYHFLF